MRNNLSLNFCQIDTLSKALTLPIASHVEERFKAVTLLDDYAPGDMIEVAIEELSFGYPFGTEDFLVIELDAQDLAREYPVSFTNTNFFTKQVYTLPTTPGEYAIAYNSDIAADLNDLLGYTGVTAGSILVLPPLTSDELGPLGLGSIQYGRFVSTPVGTPTEFNIEPPDNDIFHAIDGDENTFWIHHILKETKEPNGVVSRVKLGYDGLRAINYLEIFPVSKYPFELMGVTYINEKKIETDLRISIEQFDRAYRISFEETHAFGFVLYFKLNSFEYSVFNMNDANRNSYIVQGEIEATTLDLSKTFDSHYFKYRDELVGRSPEKPNIVTYCQYTIGLSEVTSGLKKYDEVGVFLAPPLSIESPGVIGLEVSEVGNPLYTNDALIQNTTLKGSFEYYVIKQDYDQKDGVLLKSTTIPVYPMSQDYVVERLYLSENGRTKTTFLAHSPTLANPYDLDEEERAGWCELTVYKNGVLLERGLSSTNLGVGIDGDYYIVNNTVNDSTVYRTEIAFNRTVDGVLEHQTDNLVSPADLTQDIYEVIYRPFYRANMPNFNIPVGNLYELERLTDLPYCYLSDNTVLLDQTDIKVYSELTLKIIIRNNSYDTTRGNNILHNDLTPRLNSYRLNVGQVNPTGRFNAL